MCLCVRSDRAGGLLSGWRVGSQCPSGSRRLALILPLRSLFVLVVAKLPQGGSLGNRPTGLRFRAPRSIVTGLFFAGGLCRCPCISRDQFLRESYRYRPALAASISSKLRGAVLGIQT